MGLFMPGLVEPIKVEEDVANYVCKQEKKKKKKSNMLPKPIKVKVKLATVVEGDLKAPFSITTTEC